MLPISVLDQSPIRSGGTARQAIEETIQLAQLTESLGYHRFWVSEHHSSNGLAGCSPEVLIPRIADATDRIRVGSGGVMLPHYSPFKVAENFKLLETMFPGRIDLGVGRAPGSDQLTAAALGYGSRFGAEYFPNKVGDLAAFLADSTPPTPGLERVRALPSPEQSPALWMLGSSEDSAHIAAHYGLPYSFAFFINANIREDIFSIYRSNFRPSETNPRPYASLGVFALCADSDAEAQRLSKCRDLWYIKFATESDGPTIPSVQEAEDYPYTPEQLRFIASNRRQMVIGTPEQVKTRLLDLAGRFQADELVVVSITHEFSARCRSYELMAQVFGL